MTATTSSTDSPLEVARSIFPECMSLITDLFVAIDTASSTDADAAARARPADLVQQLASAESRLQAFHKRLESHQQLVDKVEHAAQRLDEQNRNSLLFVKQLEHARHSLETLLADARHKQGLMQQASQGALDYRELLAYAHRVSKHTMSPLNASTWVVEPPIPQETHMRMSLLFRQNELFGGAQQTKESTAQAEDAGMELDLLGPDALAASALAGTSSQTDISVPAESLLDLDFE